MTAIFLPTSTTESHYEQVTPLDGRAYLLRFDWVERWGRWTLSTYTEDRELIAAGAALVANYPIFGRVRDPRIWPGTLLVVSQDGEPPGLEDMRSGGRCVLTYIPAAS